MKIASLEISNYEPIKYLKLENLGNTIIIAGANGSGKTRLKQAIVSSFTGTPQVNMEIISTRKEEVEKYFNGKSVIVQKGVPNQVLKSYINSRKYALGGYVGSVVQIDSSRNVQSLSYSAVNWLAGDPDDSETAPTYYFGSFASRWGEFMNYIHQKSAALDKKLADELKKNPSNGQQIFDNNPDPLIKYKEIFSSILPGKELQNIDPAHPGEFKYKDLSGNILPFNTLSSGEQEVVKVLFDVARKDIKHSVVIVDEPELHLHPTLTFKLIEALKLVGDHSNQFIFLTHSADLISTYYSSGDVYFIDSIQTGSNQAHRLSDLNHSHKEIVKLVGQNLGVFAVGKKLIFIEGENASIDRLTYHSIAQKIIPDAKVIPVGSVTSLMTLSEIEEQIRSSIFGIEVYMLRDRDGLTDMQIAELEKKGRIRCLKKRHIENYFLNSEILFKVAQNLYLTSTNKNLSVAMIESSMLEIAKDLLKFNLLQNTKEFLRMNHSFAIPTVKSLDKKNIDEIHKEILLGTRNSITSLDASLSEGFLSDWLSKEQKKLEELLSSDEWKSKLHGKQIFSKLCTDVLNENPIRIRQAYVDIALKDRREVFDDLIEIFSSFQSV